MLSKLTKTVLFTFWFLVSCNVHASLGEKATVASGSMGAITTLTLQLFAFLGVCGVGWGLSGFIKKSNNNGDTTGDHIKRIGIGALLFAIPAIILMVNSTAGVTPDTQANSVLGQ